MTRRGLVSGAFACLAVGVPDCAKGTCGCLVVPRLRQVVGTGPLAVPAFEAKVFRIVAEHDRCLPLPPGYGWSR